MQQLEDTLIAKGFELVPFDGWHVPLTRSALLPKQYRRRQVDTLTGPVLVLLGREAEGAAPIKWPSNAFTRFVQ